MDSTHPDFSTLAPGGEAVPGEDLQRSAMPAQHTGSPTTVALRGEVVSAVALTEKTNAAEYGSIGEERRALALPDQDGNQREALRLADVLARTQPPNSVAPGGEAVPGEDLQRSAMPAQHTGSPTTVALRGEVVSAIALNEKTSAAEYGSIGEERRALALPDELTSAHRSSSALVAINEQAAGSEIMLPRVEEEARDDPKYVRSMCRQALKLYQDGNQREALHRADVLARMQPPNSVALNLAAGLHQSFACDAMQLVMRGQKEAADVAATHYCSALKYYGVAVRLAPQCVTTAVAHGKVLAACQRFESAQAELCRAVAISSPDDPSEHNVGHDLRRRFNSDELLHARPSIRKELAHAEARSEINQFKAMICEDYIPVKSKVIWGMLKSSQPSAAENALDDAKKLAELYPYCQRAHVLVATLELERIKSVEEELSKKELLRQVLSNMDKSTSGFKNSLLIAILRANVLFLIEEVEDATAECSRALEIKKPTDPGKEDIPVGSTEGSDRAARINIVKELLQKLLLEITATIEAKSAVAPESLDAQTSQNKLNKKNSPTKEETVAKQDAIRWDDIEIPKRQGPLTYPVHLVRGQFVPQEMVILYKEYCICLSQCSEKQTACHLCCFEGLFCCKIKKNNELAHYFDKHHRKDSEPIKCKRKTVITRVSGPTRTFVGIITSSTV